MTFKSFLLFRYDIFGNSSLIQEGAINIWTIDSPFFYSERGKTMGKGKGFIRSKSERIDFYYVSKNGDIFRIWKNGKVDMQKKRKHSDGYLRAIIDGHDKYIHRLVAAEYCENKDNKKEVNHIDGNKENNHFENLEWCTRSENNKHAFETGLRDYKELKEMANSPKAIESRKKRRKLSNKQVKEVLDLLENGVSCSEIGNMYGVSKGLIDGIKGNKTYKEVQR